ncbi:MAG: hypothetical protein IAF38_15115 [Bacteroidia bacterium]|nr:hypothetical protein [Bacteroidia bacterium]
MFFNATLDDNFRRVFYIDSQDGYIGKDFDASSDSLCISQTDFAVGGNCQYTLAIGNMNDAGFAANSPIQFIMQFKIGYPMLDNEWIWDGDSAFLVSTLGFALAPNDSCTQLANKAGYANFDGTNWNYEFETGGCPKMFLGMRCPSIVHMGGAKYKLYCGNNQTPQAASSDTLKPKFVMYAFGKRYPSFDDWEGMNLARNINYLWPNGTLLTPADESKMDDFTFFAPVAGDSDFQIKYTKMIPSSGPPFPGTTYLLNP